MMAKAGHAAYRDDAARFNRHLAGVYRESVEPSHSECPGTESRRDEILFLKCLIKIEGE